MIYRTKEENRILRPLKNAHKRAGTFWEKAYQAVKHDRFASLKDGNIKALLHSMAALYLLNLYYRNDEHYSQDIVESSGDGQTGEANVYFLTDPG